MSAGLLNGKVALISGAGPGLGRAIALRCAEEGADVLLGARDEAALEAVAAEVRALGRRAVYRRTDVTLPEDCRALADLAHEQLGGVDVFVHNAARRLQPGHDVADADLDDWRRSMDVNLWGCVHAAQAVLPLMRDRGCGRIVVIGAITTRVVPGRARGDYALPKAALLQLVRNLAYEEGPSGIRVNAVVPGWIDGPTIQKLRDEGGDEAAAMIRDAVAEMPLGVMPTSYDIAGSVLFFASDLSAPVTGQCLDVNGGQYLHV